MDYRLLGNIESLGPAEFLVIASAIPNDPTGKAEVLMEDATTYQEAEGMLTHVMAQLENHLSESGDAVVDLMRP